MGQFVAGKTLRAAFLLKQGFTCAGRWQKGRDKDGLAFDLVNAADERVVYAFLVDGDVRYIGICERDHTTLRKRMGRYKSKAGGSTNKRITGEIERALKKGATVEIWALVPKTPPKHKGVLVDLVKGLENPLIAKMDSLPGQPLWNAGVASHTRSIREFVVALRRLPSDEPKVQSGVWYHTQKEHWLGWLREYGGPGYYGRTAEQDRDARYVYDHIVEPKMLLYLMGAAGVDAKLVAAAKRATLRGRTMMEKSAAIRRLVPWGKIASHLWGTEAWIP